MHTKENWFLFFCLTVYCIGTADRLILVPECWLGSCNKTFMSVCDCSYCFSFGRPEGALKSTLSLLERVRMFIRHKAASRYVQRDKHRPTTDFNSANAFRRSICSIISINFSQFFVFKL